MNLTSEGAMGDDYRKFGKHVVKFADGSYLSPNMTYASRVEQQRFAQRWLTWACAKMIAEGRALEGTGARAVRLVRSRV